MVHSFKLYGQRYALDTESGAIHMLTEVQSEILRYLTLPFESVFPSALRYDLAKYESEKLKEGYFSLSRLCDDGVLLSENPVRLQISPASLPSPDRTVCFDSKKFVFASEVIKHADDGSAVISAVETEPVNSTEYDIVESEYERIAKEIIKRRTGRIPLPAFIFTPFCLTVEKDGKGYPHISIDKVNDAFGANGSSVKKRILECAIALYFEG